MKRSITLALTGTTALALQAFGVVPAQAANISVYNHCSAGGFTGSIRVDVTFSGSSRTVTRVSYKIDKGSNSGGNDADVSWVDGGVAPTLVASTARGIQDGQWHVLRETDYRRGTGGNNASFVFDKSWASDPRCGTSRVLNP